MEKDHLLHQMSLYQCKVHKQQKQAAADGGLLHCEKNVIRNVNPKENNNEERYASSTTTTTVVSFGQ